MKCEEGHFEITFNSILTLECPLCEALKTKEKIQDIIQDIIVHNPLSDCCVKHLDEVFNKTEEL